MFKQSSSYPEMIELVKALKARYKLKIVAISNEGRELHEYRIQRYKLASFVDLFISSSFVSARKPDERMYRIALDVAQVAPADAVYVDDRVMFTEVAKSMGLNIVLHTGHDPTVEALARLGLKLDGGA